MVSLTVGNIFEYIHSSKSDQYQFITGGQGYRLWICSAISLWHSAAYVVDDSQVEDATAAMQFVWDKHGKLREEDQTGIIPGTLYQPRESALGSRWVVLHSMRHNVLGLRLKLLPNFTYVLYIRIHIDITTQPESERKIFQPSTGT